MPERIAIIGAGGHAKVVVATLVAGGRQPAMAFDDDESMWGSLLLGVPVVGPIAALAGETVDRAIVAVGNNRDRARLVEALDLDWLSAVHPLALVHPTVELGAGTIVFAGAVIQPDVRVGAHAIVNTSASIDHDCRLKSFVHISPGARLGGHVLVGTGSLVGIGAAVIPSRNIGNWATVGAGAAVTADVPDRCTAVGVPARILGA